MIKRKLVLIHVCKQSTLVLVIYLQGGCPRFLYKVNNVVFLIIKNGNPHFHLNVLNMLNTFLLSCVYPNQYLLKDL